MPTKLWQKCGIDMKELFTDEQLKAGTKLKGNINGAIFEIVKIERPQGYVSLDWRGTPELYTKYECCTAIIKDCKTGHIFQYGLEALKRCDIQILKE